MEELYMKFPAVLKDALIDKKLSFPENVEFKYEKFLAYRCIIREDENHNNDVNRKDFLSYIELGKKPKRGQPNNIEDFIEYYSASLYKNRDNLINKMHLPKPNKKICYGFVYCEGGPQATNDKNMHVDWWIYDNVDVSEFKIEGSE